MSEKQDKLKVLQDERSQLLKDQRDILNKIDEEKRELTADETTNYENMDKRFVEITDEINVINDEIEKENRDAHRREELEEREKFLKSTRQTASRPDPNLDNRDKDQKDKIEFADYEVRENYKGAIESARLWDGGLRADINYLKAYRSFLVYGLTGLESKKMPKEHMDFLEQRALQVDDDTKGGYLVAPEKMIMQLIQKLDDIVFVRKYGTTYSMPNAVSMGAPAVDQRVSDLTWSAELTTGGEDSSLKFEKRELDPHPLARRIKVSKTLLRKAFFNVENIVRDQFTYKFKTVTENAYLNGTGVNQPLGVFTNSPTGITEARDISTGNTTTAVTADGLINAKYNLKAQYRNVGSCRWCWHRDLVKMIRKLKDGNGQYLWTQGLNGKPDQILDLPFDESEYAPNTLTTGLYVGILGDWSYYWIVDALNMSIQVLTELYAESEQNGYIARYEGDGMPVLEECWSRVKLA